MTRTHWHSFWFGFMTALSCVLCVILFCVITERMIFVDQKTENKESEPVTEKEQETPQKSMSLTSIIQSLNIDPTEVEKCVADGSFAQKVQDDIDSGKKAGAQGTPHSFVMFNDALYEIPGAYDEIGMREFFDDLLANQKPKAINIKSTTKLAPITAQDHIMGKENAKITVVMYSDMDCPYCKSFHTSVTNIMPDYTESIRWVFRHMPIDASHPDAREKAETAECVASLSDDEHFWSFIADIFAQ